MAVHRASDRNLAPREQLYRLLGKMLDSHLPSAAKRECCGELIRLIGGDPIAQDWGAKWGLAVTHGVDRGMGYMDVHLPMSHVPAWYRAQHQAEHPDQPMPQPHVRFYLTMQDTQGSRTPGVGPVVNPGDPK